MKKLMGGILLAIGILIAGASGLCSSVFLIGSLGSPGTLGILPAVLLFGGPPFAAGVGLIVGGRALINSAKADEARNDDVF